MDERSHTPKGRRARDKILVAAERLLATHGFHGTSMRDVARAAQLPLATTVYHFARKEQLYAAVLEGIAAELMRAMAQVNDRATLARELVRWMTAQPERVRLLLRELLDNPGRVARAARLPMAPFLTRAAAIVGGPAPEIAVLHLVGALSYVVAARPTLHRIVGKARARELDDRYVSDALALAASVMENAHEARAPGADDSPRARSSRAADHGLRERPDAAAGRRLRGRGAVRP